MKTIKRFMKYIKPYKKEMLFIFILAMIDIGIPFLYPLAVKQILDHVLISHMDLKEKIKQILYILGGMILLFAFLERPLNILEETFRCG